jgi:hypothetical protein
LTIDAHFIVAAKSRFRTNPNMSDANLKKIGTILLVFGILAWAPFLVRVAGGQEPSIYPYLAVHLTGVIGGSRIRARFNPDGRVERPRRQIIGRILIILGVLAWAPYIYQKDILDRSIEMAPYLRVHLTGVLGGIALLLSLPLMRVWKRSRLGAQSDESLPG